MFDTELTAILDRCQPDSLLTIGDSSPAAVDRWCQAHDRRPPRQLAPGEARPALPSLGRQGACILQDALEALPHREGRHLLASLRDVYAEILVVVVDEARCEWNTEEMLGLGLRQAARRDDHGLYVFDLYDYKLTPDWLNSQYWANPEMWDKAWW